MFDDVKVVKNNDITKHFRNYFSVKYHHYIIFNFFLSRYSQTALGGANRPLYLPMLCVKWCENLCKTDTKRTLFAQNAHFPKLRREWCSLPTNGSTTGI